MKALFFILIVSFVLPLYTVADDRKCLQDDESCGRELEFTNISEENNPLTDSCMEWHANNKFYKNYAVPKPIHCIFDDLILKNIKYVGKYNYTNSAIDTTNIELAEDPEIDPRVIRTEVNTEESANLFSIGGQYEITLQGIIDAFNQKKPDYLKRISLAGLTFSTNLEYSNTGTDNNLDNLSFDVKTTKGFKYTLGVSYTGCISDLVRFKIGCFTDEDKKLIEQRVEQLNAMQISEVRVESVDSIRENQQTIASLEARIEYLEAKIDPKLKTDAESTKK